MNQYVGPYIIDKVVSTNAVKLQLPTSMRIHLLQFNNLRVDQRKEPCIRVNIKKLNRVLGTIYLLIYNN